MNQITEYRLMYQIPTDPPDRWRCALVGTFEGVRNYRDKIQRSPVASERDSVFQIESREVTFGPWEAVE